MCLVCTSVKAQSLFSMNTPETRKTDQNINKNENEIPHQCTPAKMKCKDNTRPP